MILLSQALEPLRAETDDDTTATTWHAREAGWTVYLLPRPLTVAGATEAFAQIPVQAAPTVTILAAHVMDESLYRHVHALAEARNLKLVNDPRAHLATFGFERFYAQLADLTPRSVVRSVEHGVPAIVADALAELRPPWFVKGALQSLKHLGWRACVAHTPDELRACVAAVAEATYQARGHVVVRELAPLRQVVVPAMNFPMGREFRVFLFRGDVVGHGFYWRYFDPFAVLDPVEEKAVLDLARTAAARLDVPFVSIDIAQREDGAWIVIEAGDPQFSGVSYIPLAQLWARLTVAVQRSAIS